MDIKTSDETRKLLNVALDWEIRAEENCVKLMTMLRQNGNHDILEHIKNDEHHHQQMVKQLLGFIE